jgi:hypothetical protein
VTGCSLTRDARSQITLLDFKGNNVGNRHLKYLEVDPSCTLANLVLPVQKNQIYVEDYEGILSIVDLSDEKWNILKDYELNEVPVTNWHPSTIYQNKCQTISSLVDGQVSIQLFDLEQQNIEYFTIDLSSELMKQGNYTDIDIMRVNLNQNWYVFLSLVNQSSQITPNSSLQELWIYRYNIDTDEGLSIFQTDSYSEFKFGSQFKISNNGKYAFFDQEIGMTSYGYALKNVYLIDFQNKSMSKDYLGTKVGQSWIEDKYIYYTNTQTEKSDDESVEYYLKKYDVTTQEDETITKTGIWSQSIFVLDDYIVIFHLGSSQSLNNLADTTFSANLGINLFTIIGFSLIIFTTKRRKIL